MFDSFVVFLQTTLFPLGGWGVFFATIIEEVIAPIPSTLVLLGSGAIFLNNTDFFYNTLFFTIVLPASLGMTLGTFFVYGLSWFVGRSFLDRWGKLLGFTPESVERIQKKISEGPGDELALFFLRAIPIFPSVAVSAAAGVLRIPYKTFAIMTFLGTIPRVIILSLIGWRVGSAYFAYAEVISHYENIVLSILLSALAVFIGFRLSRHFKNKKL